MDFDKLKKAAKETFRIMTGKDDEELFDDDEEIIGNDTETEPESDFDYAPEPFDDADEESDADAASDSSDDNPVEHTQRIDLKSVLQMFKSNGSDDTKQASDLSKKDPVDSVEKTNQAVEKIDKKIDEISVAADENNEKLNETLTELKTDVSSALNTFRDELSAMRVNSDGMTSGQQEFSSTVLERLNATDKKIDKITASLASVSKLNDSIFDLKNSQINTKNSLGDLEAAFYQFKKKLSTSMLIISIIAAVIVILEIINLLS